MAYFRTLEDGAPRTTRSQPGLRSRSSLPRRRSPPRVHVEARIPRRHTVECLARPIGMTGSRKAEGAQLAGMRPVDELVPLGHEALEGPTLVVRPLEPGWLERQVHEKACAVRCHRVDRLVVDVGPVGDD